jgi:hypothetical protein
MKHIQRHFIVSLFFILSISSRLSAQTSPSIWLGGFAGVDIGNISVTGNPDLGNTTFTSKTGFAIGAEFDDFFSDNFGICAQLAYVQKGTTININETVDGATANSTASATLSYLQIPILFKATFGSGALKPVVFAGPEFGFKLSAKETGKFSESGADTTVTIPDSVFTSLNIGIMLGAGLTYAINPSTMLFLNVAYDLGLTNLNAQYGKSDGVTTNSEKDITRDIRIHVGILFGLGKDHD